VASSASHDDARALLAIAALSVVSLFSQVYTRLAEASRFGLPVGAREIWLLEATSHVMVLGLAALAPTALSLAPPRFLPMRRTALIAVGAFAAFSVGHVALMYASRLVLFPILIGRSYEVNLLAPNHFLYEASKDALVFPAIVLVCQFGCDPTTAPTGEGDLKLTLANGDAIPCSRRYRTALNQK
jgi:hypothetical protein